MNIFHLGATKLLLRKKIPVRQESSWITGVDLLSEKL
jgi:hypothetical protein